LAVKPALLKQLRIFAVSKNSSVIAELEQAIEQHLKQAQEEKRSQSVP
jgi:hypothetical protein